MSGGRNALVGLRIGASQDEAIASRYGLAGPQGCPGPLSLRSALGAWLARPGAGELECRSKFHVGRATLERVVTGEVEPADELADRIWEEIRFKAPDARLAPAAEAPAAGAAAAEDPAPPPSRFSGFFMAPFHGPGGREWQIWFRHEGEQRRMRIDEARALLAELAPLVAAFDERFPQP